MLDDGCRHFGFLRGICVSKTTDAECVEFVTSQGCNQFLDTPHAGCEWYVTPSGMVQSLLVGLPFKPDGLLIWRVQAGALKPLLRPFNVWWLRSELSVRIFQLLYSARFRCKKEAYSHRQCRSP